MTLDDLLLSVPVVYHATPESNLPGVVARRRLLSPNEAYRLAGLEPKHVTRRSAKGTVKHFVPLPGERIQLADHDRLHQGHVAFDEGWDMARFIALLDGLVFFWPCHGEGPSEHALAHRKRYVGEGRPLVVLRVPTSDLAAGDVAPLLTACNSGAPRHNPKTGRQPRGASTFRTLEAFSAGAEVVEVVFENVVELPASTQWATSYEGPWKALFESEPS